MGAQPRGVSHRSEQVNTGHEESDDALAAGMSADYYRDQLDRISRCRIQPAGIAKKTAYNKPEYLKIIQATFFLSPASKQVVSEPTNVCIARSEEIL